VKRLSIIIFLCFLLTPALSRGDLYEEQLNSGLRNSEAYSYFLIKKSKVNTAEAKELLKEALKYSPDLPAVYFELSKASFSFSVEGILRAINYTLEGIAAYQRNFWRFFTASGSLFVSVILSFVVSIAVVILIRLIQNLPLLYHDITRWRK
jgi:hypothetical protein